MALFPSPSVRPGGAGARWRRFADLAFVDRSLPLPGAAPAAAPHATGATASASRLPLTHLEIAALVAPFVRAGCRLDLERSDRTRRMLRLVLPADEPPTTTDVSLLLECGRDGALRLSRTKTRHDGAQATLTLAGASTEALATAFKDCGGVASFDHGTGYVIAFDHHADVPASASTSKRAHVVRLQPSAATVRAGRATLRFTFAGSPGLPARYVLQTSHGALDAVPDDLFAVLGWAWSPLRPTSGRLEGTVRMRGADPVAEARRLTRAAARHLVEVERSSADAFHTRFAMRRVAVTARRALPLLAFAGLASEAAFAQSLHQLREASWTLPVMLAPLVPLAVFLHFSEDPRFERPRWPRRPDRTQWFGASRPDRSR